MRRRTRRLALLLIGLIVAGVILALRLTSPPPPPPGVVNYDVASRNHTPDNVDYPQNPPVGGDHAPVWQNCGYYDTPVRNENAVHSLEHGAVWITYRPDLPQDQVNRLRQLAASQPYILVSPYPGLPAPIVAS